MKKSLIFLLMVVLNSFIFASSADLISKVNVRIGELESELTKNLKENGISYQVAGGFTVNGESIEVSAYAVPKTGETLVKKFEIKELRGREDFSKLISRSSQLPKTSFVDKAKQYGSHMALILGALVLAMLAHPSIRRNRRKNRVREIEKGNEEKNKRNVA